MNKLNLKQSLILFLLGVAMYIFTMKPLNAQAIQFGVGASYGLAPTLSLEGDKSSATFYSIYADLILNTKIIGRLQYSSYNTSSFTNDLKDKVENGLGFNGSIGYNIVSPSLPNLELPVMGTIGYVSIKDRSFNWPGMQFGLTFSPKYIISEKIVANITFRYLNGSGFNDGREVSQTDVSLGLIFNLF